MKGDDTNFSKTYTRQIVSVLLVSRPRSRVSNFTVFNKLMDTGSVQKASGCPVSKVTQGKIDSQNEMVEDSNRVSIRNIPSQLNMYN